jgi:hypothetical protein
MSTRKITIGGVYRHCEGEEYEVLGECIAEKSFAENKTITTPFGRAIVASILNPEDAVVIYKNDKNIFAREQKNFLEILGKTTMYPRFWQIS